MKKVPKDIRENIQIATERLLENKMEASVENVNDILKRNYDVEFFNEEILRYLIKEALNNIVYIRL
jgi:hypothetical protein